MIAPSLKQLLTIYGRKPVLEALQDHQLAVQRLHIANSNKPSPIIKDILALAKKRGIDVREHDKKSLSRISKNGAQDQGVALDIFMPNFLTVDDFLASNIPTAQVIALDNITNPQNLGMIIRSICASGIQALLLPEKGCARLDALVIKASAGTLFKCPIIRCASLTETLELLLEKGFESWVLDANAPITLFELEKPPNRPQVFVLGNETHGVSTAVRELSHHSLSIPMYNGVESLNAAVAASLVAFFVQH